jgi:hypothetical protein
MTSYITDNAVMTAIAKQRAVKPTRGRPRTSALTRAEQLRHAKRAQRERARARGLVHYQIELSRADAERLKAGVRQPGFAQRFKEFLDDTVIAVDDYDNLRTLCWNRRAHYLGAEEAFRLYERNWRHVDRNNMLETERALIARLAQRFGNGVLNV